MVTSEHNTHHYIINTFTNRVPMYWLLYNLYHTLYTLYIHYIHYIDSILYSMDTVTSLELLMTKVHMLVNAKVVLSVGLHLLVV